MHENGAEVFPITFNDMLVKGGFDLRSVRFLRHQERDAPRGRTLYELWRDNRDEFERYQSLHRLQAHRSLSQAEYWASFVHSPEGTMFVGLYQAAYIGPSTIDYVSPTSGEISKAGTLYQYHLERHAFLSSYDGRILIKWGEWTRSNQTYFQRADGKPKQILEIKREYKDPEFPGFLQFIDRLSNIAMLPPTWVALLKSARGIYALTCPRTKELYVGSAYGVDGFYGRWKEYATTRHGGNVKLRSREPSDYQVSILEVVGSSMSDTDIIALENHWKDKLQTRVLTPGEN